MALINLTLRRVKEAPLLNDEVDTNFENLSDGVDAASCDHYGPEPSITIPGMTWGNPADEIKYRRSADNTSWLPESKLFVDMTGYSPVTSFKNKLINGDFQIWQRAASQTTSGYGSDDRWSNTHVGSTKTHSRLALTALETQSLPGFTSMSRTVVTSVAGAGNHVFKSQAIEDVRLLAGRKVTVSFYAKADAAKNIAVEFTQGFGTGGSPSAAVTGIGAAKVMLSTTIARYSVTVDIPSVNGKTIGSDDNHSTSLHFWFDAGSTYNTRTASLGQQSGTFDIGGVQVELGDRVTNLDLRPRAVEQMLCERYYEQMLGAGLSTAGGTQLAGSTLAMGQADTIAFWRFRQIKRRTPTFGLMPTGAWGLGPPNVINPSVEGLAMAHTGAFYMAAAARNVPICYVDAEL